MRVESSKKSGVWHSDGRYHRSAELSESSGEARVSSGNQVRTAACLRGEAPGDELLVLVYAVPACDSTQNVCVTPDFLLLSQIIVNNRLDLPVAYADIHTPEQYQPREWVHVAGKPVVWEACQTFSGSWGYYRDEATWKSPEQLIQMLINSVASGGNLLMNVGPTARGTFDQRALMALRVYADWIRLHARAIYGCTQSAFTAPVDSRFTQNGNRLYLHVFNWPFRHIHLEGLAGKVGYAQLLNDASEIRLLEPGKHDEWSIADVAGDTLTLELPVVKPDVVVPVIELFLK